MIPRFVIGITLSFLTPVLLLADANVRVERNKTGGLTILRPGVEQPLLVFNAPEDGRPYVHPLLAPDGKGVLTEYSPGHHKHQTGIYVGFLKVNGRDYFHNRDGNYFRRVGFQYHHDSQGVVWTSTYALLDVQQKPQLVEAQTWIFRDFTKNFVIDLTWKATANAPITFDKYDYGGLFIRMPWRGKPGSQAVNSEGHVNSKAEGQKARWVDIAMPVDGRTDPAHIAVLSHASNPGAPLPWRVDGQLGVGPAPSRLGAWKLAQGESVTYRYRFLVYTGDLQQSEVEAEWKAFSAVK